MINLRLENLTLCNVTQINKYIVKNIMSHCVDGLYSFIVYFRNTKRLPHLKINNTNNVLIM